MDGTTLGAFVGFNFAQGPWVFGGEIAYSKGTIETDDGDPYGFDSFLDLKARAGYAMENLLIYATVGVSRSRWREDNTLFDGEGSLIGVGADYQISPKMFIGAEYSVRKLKSDYGIPPFEVDADLNTLSLRLGMKF